VPKNEVQVAQVINRLLEKTRSGHIKWGRTEEKFKYQSRFGNYVIWLHGLGRHGLLASLATIEIRRLDGTIVDSASNGMSAGAVTIMDTTVLSGAAGKQLSELYRLVSSSYDDDLEELLKLIG
jgi:hypothetical protein